jgi:hypothetical protein
LLKVAVMENLLLSLKELLIALADVVGSLVLVILPLLPLVAWIGFWLFGVDWVKLRKVLLSGGFIGLLLIGVLAILVWGTISPPPGGVHYFLGLKLGNFIGKTVFVTGLTCIMLLCGAVQLSGFCASWCRFEEDAPEEQLHAAHGHDHGGH